VNSGRDVQLERDVRIDLFRKVIDDVLSIELCILYLVRQVFEDFEEDHTAVPFSQSLAGLHLYKGVYLQGTNRCWILQTPFCASENAADRVISGASTVRGRSTRPPRRASISGPRLRTRLYGGRQKCIGLRIREGRSLCPTSWEKGETGWTSLWVRNGNPRGGFLEVRL